jgi:5-formyltetrahydrofolate cyclo-ligase
MTKKEIRIIYRKKREAITEGEYLQLSGKLCDVFFSCVDLSLIHLIHTFLPIAKKKEPDTWMIVDRIRREFPHIQISVPRVNNQTGLLENFTFEGLPQIKENPWGIPEPSYGTETSIEKIDMVLVPLLIFDKSGHRVGYGKGYYDRFLERCREDCKKTGISIFPPVDIISDVGIQDKKLDVAITPDRYYLF